MDTRATKRQRFDFLAKRYNDSVKMSSNVVHKKNVSHLEWSVLRDLANIKSKRTAVLIDSKMTKKGLYDVWMTHKGMALRDIPGGRGIVKQKLPQLEDDMKEALISLHEIGFQHADLKGGATRNITFDGQNFNIIDFGIGRWSTEWSPDIDLAIIMKHIKRWVSEAPHGWM